VDWYRDTHLEFDHEASCFLLKVGNLVCIAQGVSLEPLFALFGPPSTGRGTQDPLGPQFQRHIPTTDLRFQILFPRLEMAFARYRLVRILPEITAHKSQPQHYTQQGCGTIALVFIILTRRSIKIFRLGCCGGCGSSCCCC